MLAGREGGPGACGSQAWPRMLPAPAPTPVARRYDDTEPTPTRSDREEARVSDTDVSASFPVTLIPGDGIGPEVVTSARAIVDATGAPIDWQEAEAGADVFRKGVASGVPQDTMDSIASTRVSPMMPIFAAA